MPDLLPLITPGPRTQRDRILEAAQLLFASRGFETVTMAEIARRARVARATVFNHFGSKGALVEAITERVFEFYALLLDGAWADIRSATPTLVRALFDTMGAGIEQFHGFYRGVFREIMKIQVGLEEGGTASQARDAAHAKLMRLLERGQQRGDLTREFAAADLAVAFDSVANGTINHWLYEDTSGSLRERMQRAAEVFLGPVAAAGLPADSQPLPDLLSPVLEQPGVLLALPLRSPPPRRKK